VRTGRAAGPLAALLLIGASDTGPRVAPSLFEGADPAALVADGRIWLFPTGRGGDALHAWSSVDLARWTRSRPLLRRRDVRWLERGVERGLWAPHMAAANGRYYLYFSVGPQEPLASKIGVAMCDTPAGPCRDSGRPLIDGSDAARVAYRPTGSCLDGMRPSGSGRFKFEAIDPMVFIDPASGKRLLYAGGSNGATLRLWELGGDMISVVRELPVEQPPCFTEGPWVHVRDGTYYLSYSAGHYDRSDYSVRYATGPTAAGPWTYRGAILRSAGAAKGPGHHSFFTDPRTGAWTIAYHRWEGVSGDGPYRDASRRVALARVRYGADGAILPVAP
jgi:beta-xylosidase